MGFFGNISGGSSGGSGSTTVINTPASHTVNTIAERDALSTINGATCYVKDATGDSTVIDGWAVYIKVVNSWIKISDKRISEMQSITQQEKDSLVQLDNDVQTLKSVIEDSSLVHINNTPPVDKSMLWIDKAEV